MVKPKSSRKKKREIVSGTFETKLEIMRFQIQSLETQGIEAKSIERLKKAAGLLERLETENKAAIERYRATYSQLDREKETLRSECSKQRTSSLAALNNKIDDVEKAQSLFAEYRDAKAKEFQAAEGKYDKAKREYEAAKWYYDEQQQNYQALKSCQQETENKFVEMRRLKTDIEKERNQKKKYFLNRDFELLLSKTRLKSVKQLTDELTNAMRYLSSAIDDLSEKESAFDTARGDVESLRSKLDLLDSNRREKILAKL